MQTESLRADEYHQRQESEDLVCQLTLVTISMLKDIPAKWPKNNR